MAAYNPPSVTELRDPMRITRYTDYSLRLLMYLALKKEELATIGEIAEHYGISKNHLMKVAQQLSNDGYTSSTPGRYGGLRLNRPAEEINIGALVRRLEEGSALMDCFGPDDNCVISSICQLKRLFADALEAFFAVLDDYTLADLVPERKQPQLARLLRIVNFADAAADDPT